MIPTQSEIPLLLEIVSLVFFGSVSVIVCLACFSLNRSPCSWYSCGTLFQDRDTVAWYPFSLIFVPFLSSFNNFIETLPVFLYLANCVFSCLRVFVFHWYLSSRSLVGHRWCLRWCLVIFVWLQCYMRSYACWIATLWHDTHSVWFSFHFWAYLILSLKLCRFSFISQFVFSCLRVLGITVV